MDNYLDLNREQWNRRTAVHLTSDFYDVPGWLAGKESLKAPELALLPEDLTGKTVLHLQCHFGQDTLSLARRGATVTGVDLSEAAIAAARDLRDKAGLEATFINCDLYSLPDHLDDAQQFDIVFTSYGTITWLPDLDRWASIVHRYLKPGGQFVFAEFHNLAYLWNEDRTAIQYPYFNPNPIVEEMTSTYTDGDGVSGTEVNWDHPISSVINALLNTGLTLRGFHEYDYSPYDCFENMVPADSGAGRWWLGELPGLIPLVYTLDMEGNAG